MVAMGEQRALGYDLCLMPSPLYVALDSCVAPTRGESSAKGLLLR